MKNPFLLSAFALVVSAGLGAYSYIRDTAAPTASASAAPAQSRDTSNCTWKGFKLYGKVQFVDAFPDIKIQFVDAFPDIRVEWVNAFPDDCGKWQKVTAFPDLKVQVVTAFPDLKVQEVKAFPGLP